MNLSPVRRPTVRWFGGKWRLAPWIIGFLPPHRVYIEPFGGGGSVLLRKPRSYAEVYNDLDVEVVNLYRVLRDDALSAKLVEQLYLTPFSREEFFAAYAESVEPVERARRLVVLSFQGFGSNAHAKRSTGFRSTSNRIGTTPAHDWANYPEALIATIERLRGVVIENKPAIDVMGAHDTDEAVHYVDPPYVHSTRARFDMQRAYTHEMSDEEHGDLLRFLITLRGAVVLSGYPHPLYDDILIGWRRVEQMAYADGARERVEVLWLNPACVARLGRPMQMAAML